MYTPILLCWGNCEFVMADAQAFQLVVGFIIFANAAGPLVGDSNFAMLAQIKALSLSLAPSPTLSLSLSRPVRPYYSPRPNASEFQPWSYRLYMLKRKRFFFFLLCWPIQQDWNGSFPKLGVPYLGVLIVRILLFRVLYWDPPFLETPKSECAETARMK